MTSDSPPQPTRGLVLTFLGCVGLASLSVLLLTPWDPFAGATVDPVPVDWARDFSPAEKAAADEFRAAYRIPGYLSLLTTLGVMAGLVFTRPGQRLTGWIGGTRRGAYPGASGPDGRGIAWWRSLLRVVVLVTVILLLVRVVTLPFAVWREGLLLEQGLSTRTWADWAADLARGLLVDAAIMIIVVGLIVLLASRWPAGWWRVAVPAVGATVLLVSFLYPLAVEPLFNRFEPLPQGEVHEAVLDLADSFGLEVSEVLVADASRRTSTLNAYVSGFGGSRRVVVYDTLLEQADPAEVIDVLAHELAHAQQRDVLRGTAMGVAGAAAATALLALVLRSPWLVRRTSGVPTGSVAAVPLLVLLVTGLSLAVTPVQSWVSRHVEARADIVSLDATGSADTFTETQRRIALASLQDLDPPELAYAIFASHPTAPQRIALARTWAALHGSEVPPDLAPQE